MALASAGSAGARKKFRISRCSVSYGAWDSKHTIAMTRGSHLGQFATEGLGIILDSDTCTHISVVHCMRV